MLRVTGVLETSETSCVVNIDSYVPISFRSRSQPIAGARYIRLGDFNTQLLELQFPPESLALSGFTLVSGEGTAQGGLRGVGASAVGLPIVSLPRGEAFSNDGKISHLDIQTEVVLTCTDGNAEVRLGSAKIFDRTLMHGRAQFLLSEDILVGLRLLDLTEKERHILQNYVAEHPRRPI